MSHKTPNEPDYLHYLVIEIEGFTALSTIVADLHTHPSVRRIHLVDDDRIDNLHIFALSEDPTVVTDDTLTHNRNQIHNTL